MVRKLSRADIRQLHELGAMKDKGILTGDEFAELKVSLFESQETVRKGRPALWIAGAALVLVIVAAVVDTTSGGSAAHGIGQQVFASHG